MTYKPHRNSSITVATTYHPSNPAIYGKSAMPKRLCLCCKKLYQPEVGDHRSRSCSKGCSVEARRESRIASGVITGEGSGAKGKVRGEFVRARLMDCIRANGRSRISDLSQWLELSNATVSHHLRLLAKKRLVDQTPDCLYGLTEAGMVALFADSSTEKGAQ